MRALEMVAPGTALREGIDNILHARTGGLLVIGEPDELTFLYSGGIRLDIDYTPALVYQLAKMDGAIIAERERHEDRDGQRPADARSRRSSRSRRARATAPPSGSPSRPTRS